MRGQRQAARVAILHDPVPRDAPPDQLDTLVQARAVANALSACGFTCRQFAFNNDPGAMSSALRGHGSDVVFNLVESVSGHGDLAHLAPAWLEAEGIPFTGSSSDCILLTTDKPAAKRWMRSVGIPVPADFDPDAACDVDLPFIVKSRSEDASLGLDPQSVVKAAEVPGRIENCRTRYGGDWFAEQFVEGREFNVALLEIQGQVRVLPPAEIVFEGFPEHQPRIVDYRAKWDPESVEYRTTQRVFPRAGHDRALLQQLGAIALRCWRLFGLSGYARVDFRVDAAGTPFVLEVNANPCLSPDAGFAAALEQAGIAYPQATMLILEAATTPPNRVNC